MKICLRFVTELQLKLEQELQLWLFAGLCFRYVPFVTLRCVSFRSFVRFSVCPKTFLHMHLSAKACHFPSSPTPPYVSTRHNSLRLWGPLSVWKCSVVCHFSQNFKYSFFPQLILWDAVQVRAAAVAFRISCSALFCYFSLPLSPHYPRYAISQAALGHFERLIIWQLVCEVSHKARHERPFANPYRWAVERCPRAYERHDDWPNSRHTSWSWYTCLASLQSGNAAASLEFRHRKCDRSVKKVKWARVFNLNKLSGQSQTILPPHCVCT